MAAKAKTKKAASKAKSSKAKASKAGASKTAKKAKPGPKKPLRRGPDTEVDEAVLEFIAAIDEYKRVKNRPFPTWSEILRIVRELGYTKGEKS